MGSAKVAGGRCIHIPTGKMLHRGYALQRIDTNGVVVGENREVTMGEVRIAGPGEIVELPVSEITRFTELGFLVAIEPAKKARPETGIDNDPRVKTTATAR